MNAPRTPLAFDAELDALQARGLDRRLRVRPAAGPAWHDEAGRRWLNFSSNDYLNLATDPRLRDGAVAAVRRWGCGAGASRLTTGHLPPHEALEEQLAGWMGAESALLFGSGFLANLGLVSCLAEAGTGLFMDRLNHASLIDGARLAGARIRRYPHGDADALDALLSRHGGETPRRAVLTESVFSMDGDLAPLEQLAQVCLRHDAWLVVDEAHALGIFGPAGAGCWPGRAPEARHGQAPPLIRVGTLSKALGAYGGFVAGPRSLTRWLVNRARGFIFSTGLPPACLGAAMAALDVLESEPALGPTLLDRAERFRVALRRHGLETGASASPIVPIALGDNRRALRASRALEDAGVVCSAIRPPTVPPGTARLRLSLSLGHSAADLDAAAERIATALAAPDASSKADGTLRASSRVRCSAPA